MKTIKRLLFISLLILGISINLFSQNKNWVALPQEVNNPVHVLDTFKGELIAGGWFSQAGQLKVGSIASWNGSKWNNLGGRGGISLVTSVLSMGSDLYVAGYFDSGCKVATRNIAKWDGMNWSALGRGTNGEVNTMALYNNENLIAGHLDSADGKRVIRIAKWDGTTWQPLGAGINRNSIRQICEYKNKLYAVGLFDSTGHIPCNNIARWDGITWDSVSRGFISDHSAMIVWENKLLISSAPKSNIPVNDTDEARQLDGVQLSTFSKLERTNIKKFLIFNKDLYCAGDQATPPSKWNSSIGQWEKIGTGPNQSVLALAEYKGELYCVGSFTTLEKSNLNFIGRLSEVNEVHSVNEKPVIELYPNPFKNLLSI